jgi:hypothetical protein
MKSSNHRKKVISIVITALVLVCGIVGYTAANSESVAKLFGKAQSQALTNAGNGIVAIVDGEKITKKGFDTYKIMLGSENKLSDEEILDKIVERKVEYTQAVKEGLLASDEQVDSAIKYAQETIKMDSKQYDAFKEYISGLNMSEDEYWVSVKPAYKKALTCGAYKKTLKQKFKKDNKIENANELNSKFSEFYNQKVKQLKGQAKVQSFIK